MKARIDRESVITYVDFVGDGEKKVLLSVANYRNGNYEGRKTHCLARGEKITLNLQVSVDIEEEGE